MEKRGGLFLLFVLIILSTTSVFATEIEDSLHLNIQTTDALGDVINGTFNFMFYISNSNTCDPILYSRLVTLTTDSRGIISYYLNNTKLNYSEQYWLCYYRDGALIETSKIVRTPYAFNSKNTTLVGTIIDVNLNMGNYNITTTGTGFFGFLGSLVNRITSLFVQNIDFTGNINGTGNITTTGRIGIGTEIPSNALEVRGTINASGIIFYNNGTPITTLNETGLINSVNTTANIQNLLNSTGIYTYSYNHTLDIFNLYNSIWLSTYNSTYATYLYGLRNETLDTFNNYNSTWDNNWVNQFAYNHTLSTIGILGTNFTALTNNLASVNTTANIQTLINGTNANFANVEFNGGWTNGGASIINGNIFARAAYFYNITGLDTTTLKINGSLLPTTGWDDTFDIGSSSLRWKNLYLSGDARINGTIYYGNEGIPITALNETGLINSVNSSAQAALTINTTTNINNLYPVNTTANIQNLVNAIYVPYEGASANVNLGIYNLTTTGNVGIGTSDPSVGFEYNNPAATNTTDKMILIGGYLSGHQSEDYGFSQAYQLKHSSTGAIWTAARIKAVESAGYGGQLIFETNPTSANPLNVTTEKMRILANGNVGIGTASPNNKFEVNGADGIYAQVTSTGANSVGGVVIVNDARTWTIRNNGGDDDKFQIRDATADVQRLTIDSSGNVGIGTASPKVTFQSSGGSAGAGAFSPTLGSATGGNYYLTNLDPAYGLLGGSDQSGNTWLQVQRTDATAEAYNLNLQPSGGNVGIGTTTPSKKLEVATSSATGILLTRASTGNSNMGFNNSVGVFYAGLNSLGSADFSIGVNGDLGVSPYITILQSNGNVGIGTTSPVQILTLQNTNSRPLIQFSDSGGNALFYAGLTNATNDINPGTLAGDFIMRAVNKNISISTDNGATSLIFLTKSGNVGIGTTNPTRALSINTSGNTVLDLNGNGDVWTYYNVLRTLKSAVGWRNDTLALTFWESGSDRMVIKDGNVGIGTTSPTGKIDIFKSELNNTAFKNILVVGGNENDESGSNVFTESKPSFGIGFTRDWNNNGLRNLAAGIYLWGTSNWGGGLAFRTASAVAGGPGTMATRMVITDTGLIGIGTTSPGQTLDVSGKVQLYSGRNNDATIAMSTAGWNRIIGTNAGGHLAFFTAGHGISDDSPQMLIEEDGNVGIGTTTPFSTPNFITSTPQGLHINLPQSIIRLSSSLQQTGIEIGSGGAYNYIIFNSTATNSIETSGGVGSLILQRTGGNVGIGTTSPGVKLTVNGAIESTPTPGGDMNASGLIFTDETTSTRWQIHAHGNVLRMYNGATETTVGDQTSSIRFKENITPLNYGLKQIKLLNPVSFKYKTPYYDGRQSIGFIVEEVNKIIPEIVSYDGEGKPYSINYGLLTSLTIKGVQEQQIQIEELKTENENLKKENELIKSELCTTKNYSWCVLK